MDFFDNFKLKKTKSGKFSIIYDGKSLATINPDVVMSILKELTSKKFKSLLLQGVDLKPIDDAVILKAIQLEKAYTTRRKKFLRNKNLKSIDRKTKEFQHFIKAVETVIRHKTNYQVFLSAQVDGLSFVNNGAGIFPKPSQLSNANAEERLIQFLHDEESENDVENVVRLELSYSDRNTDLSDNPTYQARYKAMKDETATLQHAYFVFDCQVAMKGFATNFVIEYIEELEE